MGQAGSGREALELARERNPDVAVMDLSMPGMDGFELISTLRVRGVDVPVLVITARDSSRDRVAAVAAGVRGCRTTAVP